MRERIGMASNRKHQSKRLLSRDTNQVPRKAALDESWPHVHCLENTIVQSGNQCCIAKAFSTLHPSDVHISHRQLHGCHYLGFSFDQAHPGEATAQGRLLASGSPFCFYSSCR